MANNPKHKDNLVPFPKGVSGNPKGAPKSRILKEMLTADLLQESNGVTKIEAILNKLTTLAVKGDLNAIKEVLDRYAGKSTQLVEAVVTNLNVQVLNIDPYDDSADHSASKNIGTSQTD